MGLDAVELLLAVEEHFGVHVDDAVAADLKTPGLLADYVWTVLCGDGRTNALWTRERVLMDVIGICARHLGLPASGIRADARFAEDLGLDR